MMYSNNILYSSNVQHIGFVLRLENTAIHQQRGQQLIYHPTDARKQHLRHRSASIT